MHTSNSKNEKVLKEEKSKYSDDSSYEDIELEDIQNTTEETPEQAEILEDLEQVEILNEEELEELLESEKESDMSKKMKKLEEENKKLQNEVQAFKDKLLRTAAEYENFRRRTSKEKEGIYTDACADVLKEVLPALDSLERALVVDEDSQHLRTGVELTVRQFNDAFSKLGVEPLASEGEFDPNLHDAVMHIQDEQYGKNEIVEVFQKGYKRANKVLRHSMVKVAN